MCEFSKVWPSILNSDKCSGHVEKFGTLTQNVRPELENLKSVTQDDFSIIDVKTLVANRISPHNIEDSLANLNICQFHLVRNICMRDL